MKYFYVNLAAHIVVFIALIVLMLVFIGRNQKRKTKHGFIFFLPVVLMMVSVLDLFLFAGPRILDIDNMVSGTYQFEVGKVEETGVFNNTIVVNGKTFYVNPLADIPEAGTNIRIKHTEHSNYVVELAETTTDQLNDIVEE